MRLSTEQAAMALGLSEDQIRRMARRGELPAFRLRDDWWFHREDLLDWATGQGIDVSAELFPSEPMPSEEDEFVSWLRRGGVHCRLECSNAEELLATVVSRLPLEEADQELVLEALRTRERGSSSGLGGGIAVPHVHDPLVVHGVETTLGLFFPTHPVEFAAFDDQPVHTFFCLLTPSVRAHQHALTRLALALHDSAFVSALEQRAPDAILLAAAQLGGSRGL